jgi:HEAT repeat protein
MDHNDDIRIWVRRLIGKLGSSVIDNLLFTLENENDNTIRSAAAISLGIVRDAKAIDPLINTVLNDTDDWVRRYAAEALGEIGEKEVAGPLVETLLSPNPDLALYASRALGKLGPDAVDCLLPVLDSKNKNQRFLGICSLAELQVGEVYEELINLMAETDRKLHERVKEAAVNVGPDLISHLISGLGASDWNIRSNASDILLEIGETAVPALELAQNDENKEVQYWVSKTLRNIIKDLKHVGGGA